MKVELEHRMNELFEKYVPASGHAETVGGEIVRAVNRIGYRSWNDGDCIGVGYGNETCNAAARFLIANCAQSSVPTIVRDLWGTEYDYDDLDVLFEAAIDFLDRNPMFFAINTVAEMFDYREDSDFEWEGEDELNCWDELYETGYDEEDDDDDWEEDDEDDGEE